MSNNLNTLKVNIPNIATKQLKLQSCSSGRKLTVSTNFLPLFGFEANAKVVEELIGTNKGIRIRLANKDDLKPKKVYQRTYNSRKNNPLETMLDIRSQKLINEAFPLECSKVHIVFQKGVITITPITNKQANAIKDFKNSKDTLSTFLACSSGVDGKLLNDDGFKISTMLEFRPQEKRDKTNLEETGCITGLVNFPVDTLINEDIMNLDLDKIAALTMSSNHTLMHASPQCDDFSNIKANSLKERSLDDGSSTLDMVIDIINIIDKFNFPTILIENVSNFFTNSDAGKILMLRLKRFGYKVHFDKYDARDYGGLTSRVRGYLFATLLPTAFIPPIAIKRNDTKIWDKLIEEKIISGELRDVSECSSTKNGVITGRARLIKRSSLHCPSILKSQNRQSKDSAIIYDDKRDKYYFPSNELLSELMDIDMNFEGVGKTIASEQIGQSVEVPLHKALLFSVKDHINSSYAQLNGRLF